MNKKILSFNKKLKTPFENENSYDSVLNSFEFGKQKKNLSLMKIISS